MKIGEFPSFHELHETCMKRIRELFENFRDDTVVIRIAKKLFARRMVLNSSSYATCFRLKTTICRCKKSAKVIE